MGAQKPSILFILLWPITYATPLHEKKEVVFVVSGSANFGGNRNRTFDHPIRDIINFIAECQFPSILSSNDYAILWTIPTEGEPEMHVVSNMTTNAHTLGNNMNTWLTKDPQHDHIRSAGLVGTVEYALKELFTKEEDRLRILVVISHMNIHPTEVHEFLPDQCSGVIVFLFVFPWPNEPCALEPLQNLLSDLNQELRAYVNYTREMAICGREIDVLEDFSEVIEQAAHDHRNLDDYCSAQLEDYYGPEEPPYEYDGYDYEDDDDDYNPEYTDYLPDDYDYEADDESSSSTLIIIIICIAVAVLLLAGLSIGGFVWYRKRQEEWSYYGSSYMSEESGLMESYVSEEPSVALPAVTAEVPIDPMPTKEVPKEPSVEKEPTPEPKRRKTLPALANLDENAAKRAKSLEDFSTLPHKWKKPEFLKDMKPKPKQSRTSKSAAQTDPADLMKEETETTCSKPEDSEVVLPLSQPNVPPPEADTTSPPAEGTERTMPLEQKKTTEPSIPPPNDDELAAALSDWKKKRRETRRQTRRNKDIKSGKWAATEMFEEPNAFILQSPEGERTPEIF